MTSLTRKRARLKGTYKPRPQLTIVHDDGSYSTLRPTKGWIHFSKKRLDAQFRMAQLLGA